MAAPVEYDFASLESIQTLLRNKPQATFKFETLTKAILLNNVDVVTLMIIQNQQQNKPFSRDQLAEALVVALQKPRLTVTTETASGTTTTQSPDIAMIKQLLAAGAGAGKIPAGMGVCGNNLQAYILSYGIELETFPEIILWAINNSYLSPNDGVDLVVSLGQEARRSARDSNRASQNNSRAGSARSSQRSSQRASASRGVNVNVGVGVNVNAAAVNPTVSYTPAPPQAFNNQNAYQLTDFEIIPAPSQ